jgi:hypothetical protein
MLEVPCFTVEFFKHLAPQDWLLFHSHLRDMCRDVPTSGDAEARASVYPRSPKSH